MENKYKEAMDHVQVTDEMRERIVENIEHREFMARTKRRNNIVRVASLAACLVIVAGAGVAINIAKELMGHSSITVTADIYTHRNLSILHQNISRLDSLDTGNFQQNSLF